MIKLPKSFSDFKKHFSSIFSYNKKNLILGISLGLFLCFFSFQVAHAYIPIVSEILTLINYVLTMPIRIPFLILVIVVGVLGLVSSIIFGLAATILSWLIEASLSIKVVPGPEAFEVINVGFEFTKNFANMFIILILAIIGLATILKIREYEARKILPKLIMVALLINFTPVMVGFIVDIANLFTNFFFTTIIGSGAFGSIDLGIDMMGEVATVMDVNLDILNVDNIVGTLIPIIVEGIMMIFFYNIAALVYFLVFLLFFARFIILWVLVILAPIAFFSQILPESPTVKALFPSILHWNKWWETLIQWAFVGIPLGFFLYLSTFIMSTPGGKMPTNIMDTTFSGAFSAIIEAMLVPMIAIFMLIVGIIVSVESMPGVAKQIINRAKGVGKGVGKRAGRLAKRPALALGEKAGARMQAWGKRQRLAVGAKTPEQMEKAGRLKKWGWAIRRQAGTTAEIAGREAVAVRQETETADVENAKKQIQGKTEEKQMNALQIALVKAKTKMPGATTKVIGTMEAMMEDGTLEKAENAGVLGEKEKKKYLKEAKQRNRKTLYAYDPKTTAQVIAPEKWESAQKMRDSGNEEDVEKGKELQKEILGELLGKIKPSNIKLMSEKSLTDDVVKNVMVDTLNGNQMAEVGKNFGRHIIEGIQKEIEGKKTAQKVAEKNPSLALWLHGNAAQNLGFKLPGKHLGPKQIKLIVSEARKKIETEATGEKGKMKTKYVGKEALMFRNYYRKDVSERKKGLIKQIVTEEGKTIPPEAEIKRRIGNWEKDYDKFNKQVSGAQTDLTKVKKAYDAVEKRYIEAGKPMTGDLLDTLLKTKEALNDAQNNFKKTESEAKKIQSEIEERQEKALQDLWK